MADLLWPGDHRAGSLMSDSAIIDAMIVVERVWLAALVEAGIAPGAAADRVDCSMTVGDIASIAVDAEDGGNPVIPLVRLLRGQVEPRNMTAAKWIHRGLTSQDVLDTALVLCLRDVLDVIDEQVIAQVQQLIALAEKHSDTVMVGRTLTQHAVPMTFGGKAANWLDGLLDAAQQLRTVRRHLPAQLGGAVGTLAAITELFCGRGHPDSDQAALTMARSAAKALGLSPRRPWHTTRTPLTSAADALIGYTDVLGHIAADITTAARPEIAELAEPGGEGRGGSSTMPNKANPILAVLIRRTALAVPMFGASLHTAAATAVDERPDGSWHIEWSAIQTLARRTSVAALHATNLLNGLEVNVAQMTANLAVTQPDTLAEQRSMKTLLEIPSNATFSDDPMTYLGATRIFIEEIVQRGNNFAQEKPCPT